MCVAPVLVQHKLSNCIVKAYVMLDNCSQANFMRNKLLGALGLHGRKASITVKTMNGEETVILSARGFEVVQGSNENKEKLWLQLSSNYTQEDLLVDIREIANSRKTKKIGVSG